jgi:transcriptional regulator with XRE-family HTH domain
MQIFERLKTERERLGYNQTDFAALAHASRKTVFNWESGVGSPGADALAAWAQIGLDVLLVVTGDPSFVPPKRLTSEEETMLDYFQQADKSARKAALHALLSAAPSTGSAGTKRGSIHQTINAPVVGNVSGGSVNISNKVKNNR